MIKLIASDIDGTLLQNGNQPSFFPGGGAADEAGGGGLRRQRQTV